MGRKRQRDDCVDCRLTCPNTNCTNELRCGGLAGCLLEREAASSDKHLTRHVTPWISGAFGPAVGAILAMPLLWDAFDSEVCERVFPAL